jgi:hypothetical protein
METRDAGGEGRRGRLREMTEKARIAWSDRSVAGRLGALARLAAAGLVLAAVFLVAQSQLVGAQGETPPVGSVVRVASPDGEPLNLRAGASDDQLVVARLPVGEEVTVVGPLETIGPTRWVPVRTADGVYGWVSAQYLVLVTAPMPDPSPSPELALAPTETPTLTPESLAPVSTEDPNKGKPVEVEAKLKYPEARGTKQEITVWVARDGVPIVGAMVTVVSMSGDDDEPIKAPDPTDDEGKTRRLFSIRREKGGVELRVEALAPDGGRGSTVVTYFRR